jgi:hypothetical protein
MRFAGVLLSEGVSVSNTKRFWAYIRGWLFQAVRKGSLPIA